MRTRSLTPTGRPAPAHGTGGWAVLVAALLAACGDPVTPDLPTAEWTAISAGSFHTCGVVDGRGYCWGANQAAQLGGGPGVLLGFFPRPLGVTGGHAFEEVLAGGLHTCGLDSAGEARCWGLSDWGELGLGDAFEPESCYDAPCSSSPRSVTGLGVVGVVAIGYQFGCALGEGGQVACWGRNDMGQLGIGEATGPSDVPVAPGLPQVGGFVGITAGREHACALSVEGSVYCWGQNEYGQLGRAAGAECTIGEMTLGCDPTPASAAEGSVFVQIVAGGAHTCGSLADGGLRCWGLNGSGQLGVAPEVTSGFCGLAEEPRACTVEPVLVSGDVVFASVSAGTAHTCGIDPAGSAYCWGRNPDGELGSCGIDVFVARPRAVCGGHRFTQISAGDLHTCAVSVDGTAYCWGRNDTGQLGTPLHALGPAAVSPPPGFR